MTVHHESDTTPEDTTELRWFADGPLPEHAIAWFTRSGTKGAIEERTDDYRSDGRPDVGFKWRAGATPELKVRQSTGPSLSLGPGLSGRTEHWRKWSPAIALRDSDAEVTRVSVDKRVVKRLFGDDGTELTYSNAARSLMASGCAVELTTVTVHLVRAWTFAFAAFGPKSTRDRSILMCWRSLIEHDPAPDDFTAHLEVAAGYPEWLRSRSRDGRH